MTLSEVNLRNLKNKLNQYSIYTLIKVFYVHTWWHTTPLRHGKRKRHRINIRSINKISILTLNLRLSNLSLKNINISLQSLKLSFPHLHNINSIRSLQWHLYLLYNLFVILFYLKLLSWFVRLRMCYIYIIWYL